MKKLFLSLGLILITTAPAYAWGPHAGKMDTDGILSPGELRNPRINYNRPSYYVYNNYPQTFGVSGGRNYNRPGYYYRDDYYRNRNDKDCYNDRYYYDNRSWWQRW